MSGHRDGLHWSPTPEVPWSQATTGQPPFGAPPSGTNTIPVTATGPPGSPVDRYMTRVAADACDRVGR